MNLAKKSIQLHTLYRGKIQILPKCRISSFDDFAIWYTPGVAAPCKGIVKDTNLVYKYTNKWNTIAIVTDGTRVLGLGKIGAVAALPVMEGKALLFKYLGGVDAIPLCLGTTDTEEFITTIKFLEPSFGAINLEDIEQPKCFEILSRLREESKIPVWHDDQQGTATVVLAGLINALRIIRKKIDQVRITLVGAGAAGICCARLLFSAGVNPEKMVVVDSKGTLHPGRTDLKKKYKEKWSLCLKTNKEKIIGGIPDALSGADILIALSKSGPGIIKKEWIKKMMDRAVVFACANPVPEIYPWEAKEAGAEVVATGRSDFPNQINNSLVFPGIFRGVLDVLAKTITDEMCLAAADEIANYAFQKGLRKDYIVPTMYDWEMYARVAAAVGTKAISQKIAQVKLSKEELYERAKKMILYARKATKLLSRYKLLGI